MVNNNLIAYLDAAVTTSYSSGATTWSDLSGNGNHTPLTGTHSLDTDGGGSIDFASGAGGIVPIPLADFSPNGGTIEAWCKITDTSGYRHIVGWRNSQSFYLLLLSNNGKIEARDQANGDIATTDIGAATWANNWSQVVFTTEPGNQTAYYRNGQLVNNKARNSNGYSDTSGCIIAKGFGTPACKHSVFRAYDRPLTASEVLQNYEFQRARHGL